MSEVATSYYSLFFEEKNEGTGVGLISPSFWMFPRGGSGSITAGSRFMVTHNIMSAIPISKAKTTARSLVSEFNELAKTWKRETRAHSSLGEIFTNDAYQRILGMGTEALPLILGDLQKAPGHWFYALEKIVGKDIAKGANSFGEARSLWLEWGYKQNYI